MRSAHRPGDSHMEITSQSGKCTGYNKFKSTAASMWLPWRVKNGIQAFYIYNVNVNLHADVLTGHILAGPSYTGSEPENVYISVTSRGKVISLRFRIEAATVHVLAVLVFNRVPTSCVHSPTEHPSSSTALAHIHTLCLSCLAPWRSCFLYSVAVPGLCSCRPLRLTHMFTDGCDRDQCLRLSTLLPRSLLACPPPGSTIIRLSAWRHRT